MMVRAEAPRAFAHHLEEGERRAVGAVRQYADVSGHCVRQRQSAGVPIATNSRGISNRTASARFPRSVACGDQHAGGNFGGMKFSAIIARSYLARGARLWLGTRAILTAIFFLAGIDPLRLAPAVVAEIVDIERRCLSCRYLAPSRAGVARQPGRQPRRAGRAVRAARHHRRTHAPYRRPLHTVKPILVADSVAKSFRGRRVLSSATLRAVPGELRVLFGRNGAGKSTLLRIAAGWTAPDSGCVHFAGEAYVAARPTTLAARGLFFSSGSRLPFARLFHSAAARRMFRGPVCGSEASPRLPNESARRAIWIGAHPTCRAESGAEPSWRRYWFVDHSAPSRRRAVSRDRAEGRGRHDCDIH